MRYKIFLTLLLINFSFSQEKIDQKEIVSTLCEKFSSQYSIKNSFENNRMLYIKNIEIKLQEYDQETRDNILRKLHEFCPSLLEYSYTASKNAASEKGNSEAFKLWDIFYKSKNDKPWTLEEKDRFLSICYYALSKRANNENLCNCSIDKIAEHLTADYFLNLSIAEQGYLAGQVDYVYCSN